jgi:hypothetical protein
VAIRPAYPFVLKSGILHVIYFFGLYKGYQHMDISVIYPITARGTAMGWNASVEEAVWGLPPFLNGCRNAKN